MHNHNCKHEKVTYCKECNKVYCECGMEWECALEHTIYPIPYTYPIPVTFVPWTYWDVGGTCDGSTLSGVTTHSY